MLQKRLLGTFIAFFLLIAGLLLLYYSNINKTIFVDISADSPFIIDAENQAKGVVVTKNSEINYTVSLPSSFLYQTKTVQIQNTDNGNVQLKFYSQQKKDGDKTIKFSIDVKKITVNEKVYNTKKQTVWFERPYSVDITTEKDGVFFLIVQYKTRLLIRNAFLPTFLMSIAFLLGSIVLFLVCWYRKIKEKLYSIVLFLVCWYKKINEKFYSILSYECKHEKYAAICLWYLLIAIFSFFIIYNANWILGDDHEFLSSITAKNCIVPIIYSSIGRFMPLLFQEFNILLFFSLYDPFWFYCISCFEFIITALFFTLFLKELSKEFAHRILHFLCVLFLFCLIISPSVLSVFIDVIFPERNVLCLLSIFMYFYWKGIKKERLSYILIASVMAVLSFYYKEPVFGAFVVFCVCPFLFDYKNVSKEHKIFSSIIGINVFIYVLLYYFLVYQFTIRGYNEGRVSLTYFENLTLILKDNFYFILILLFACFRFIRIVCFKEKKYLLTDSLLFSGIAYFCAFIFLKLNAQYYFMPVYILTLPAFFVYVISLKNMLAVLLCCILFFSWTGINVKNLTSDIQGIQSSRMNDMKSVDLLCEKINNGYEIFYLQVQNSKPENAFDNTIMKYWCTVLEIFIKYRLGYAYKLTVVDELFPLTDKQILISPQLTTKEREVDFTVLGDVSNYLMYSNVLTVYEKNSDKSLPASDYKNGRN